MRIYGTEHVLHTTAHILRNEKRTEGEGEKGRRGEEQKRMREREEEKSWRAKNEEKRVKSKEKRKK